MKSAVASQFSAAEEFTLAFGQALHRLGAPSHRLEDTMEQIAQHLDVKGQFMATPTSILVSFGDAGHQRMSLVRADQGEINLEKLSLLERVCDQVLAGELDAAAGTKRIEAIMRVQPRYKQWATIISFGVASGSAARMFGGGWREVGVSMLIGMLIGTMSLLSEKSPTLGRVFEVAAAVLAALGAGFLAQFTGTLSVYVVTLSGLIVLLPGLTLTVALTELASRHVVSGTARLMGAGITFMKLGFGVALGTRLAGAFVDLDAMQASPALPDWTLWMAIVAASLSFTVLFQAEPRETGWILLVGALGLMGSRLGGAWLGPELAPFLGALGVTLGSNVYSRVLDRQAMITQVPGLILLVPGSVGYRSFSALFERNVVSGMETAFTTVLTATALVAGTLVANSLVSSRRVLREGPRKS